MNATVTRSAARSTSSKGSGKAPAKATATKAKSGTPKPVSKVATATKASAKPANPATKSVTKAAAKPVSRKPTMPTATRVASPKATASKGSKTKAGLQQTSKETIAIPRSMETSGNILHRSEEGTGLTDTMANPVVSKVTEVATKTSKQNDAPASGTLLTEEEILKMSDKDYMNEAQLAFFKNRLQQLERELLKNAGETTEHLRETVLVPDPADRATIEEEHALELRTRDRERKLLKKVQQAIASIDAGDYGYCEETGEPIGIPRLLARPTATLSLEAQQRRELKQKLYGD